MENQPNWQIVIESRGRGYVVDVIVADKTARKQTERILDALEPILAAPNFNGTSKQIMRRSRELARQSEELAGRTQELMKQTQRLLEQFHEGNKTTRKKLGST